MKKYLFFLIPLLLIIIFLLSIPIVNNICAIKVKIRLEKTPLPEYTECVESVWRAGKLNGNGNGMQYLGVLLLKSELSFDELDNFYEQYRENEYQYILEKPDNNKAGIIEHGELLFSYDIDTQDNYYMLYSWGEGIAPFSWLDLRGN